MLYIQRLCYEKLDSRSIATFCSFVYSGRHYTFFISKTGSQTKKKSIRRVELLINFGLVAYLF